ncbi:MAG: hypothetical protein R6U96_07580 [Promethearchaeia archaeon]
MENDDSGDKDFKIKQEESANSKSSDISENNNKLPAIKKIPQEEKKELASESQNQDDSSMADQHLERKKRELFLKRNTVLKHNQLFIIPSWSDLLGHPTLGKYVGQKVSKIVKDIAIFYGGTECAVETEKGTLYFLFGLGYHYLKFELQEGKYITDSRILTGLVLSDFVYDLMASSDNVTLNQDKDVIIADKIIKIPLDLSNKTDNQKTFIKGAIMRNVFIPNKEIILEMMDKIRDPQNYRLKDWGHLLLGATWDHFNTIMVSDNMKMYETEGYLNSTAGLDKIEYGADSFINEQLSPVEQEIVEENFIEILHIYSNLKYDPIYPFSIIKNVRTLLPDDDYHPSPAQKEKFTKKRSILLSAEDRIDSIKEWPVDFERKKLEEKAASSEKEYPKIQVKQSSEMYDMDIPKSDVSSKDYREEREDFELRILKNPQVEIKPVPSAPTGDVEEIFYYLKYVVEEDYDMPSIGKAFEMARDNLRTVTIQSELIKKPHQNKMWEMSKTSNIYQKEKAGYGLNRRDKTALLEKIDSWIEEIKKKREERERLEREKREEKKL